MDSTKVSSSSDGERKCPENDQFRRRRLFSSSFSFCSSPLVVVGAALLCRNNEDFEEDEKYSFNIFVFFVFPLFSLSPLFGKSTTLSLTNFHKSAVAISPRFISSQNASKSFSHRSFDSFHPNTLANSFPVPIGSCPTGTQYPADKPNSLSSSSHAVFNKENVHDTVPSPPHATARALAAGRFSFSSALLCLRYASYRARSLNTSWLPR